MWKFTVRNNFYIIFSTFFLFNFRFDITYSQPCNSGIWEKIISGYCDDMPVSCMRRGALSPSPCTVLQTCSCTWLPFLTRSNTFIYLIILASGDHRLGSDLFAAYQVECSLWFTELPFRSWPRWKNPSLGSRICREQLQVVFILEIWTIVIRYASNSS
jgi:hypothetical protein